MKLFDHFPKEYLFKCLFSTSVPPRYKLLKDLSAHAYTISSVLVKIILYLTFLPLLQSRAHY